jgi:hypothetical protein
MAISLFIPNEDDFQEHCHANSQSEKDLATIIQYISEETSDGTERNKLIAQAKAWPRQVRADFAGRIRKIRQQEQAEAEIIPLRQPAPADAATWQEFAETIEGEKPKHVDKNEYTITENYVIEHPELGGREIAIYCLLVYRAHMPKKTCIASIAGLARRTGWTRNTVAAALDRLIETGCVVRGERQPGGAYVWTMPHRHRSKKKAKR